MKTLLKIMLCIMLLSNSCFAEQMVLNAGISIDDVPETLFGVWRITAKLDSTDSYQTFKPQSADIWNLSRTGDRITLHNPFTGASSEISLKTVEGNLVVFSKKAPYNNKVLTDTIAIRLDGNKFSGINTLLLESYSYVDKHLLKKEQARYLIKGEKISGESIIE